MYVSTTKDSKGNAATFTLKNLDSGYVARYNALKSIVDKLVSETKGMTDLDKVVYMHDYIVRNATYSKSSNLGYFASGILVDGKGLCNGYANALKLLLRQSGVDVKFVTPSGMQHEWVLIKIDGEWYHADPTWDDTRSSVSGKVSHKFLIRNDAEFSVEGNNKHYGWTGTLSSSTKYTNWFVHNIVGDMYYYNGYWYYADASIKGIKKAKIDGSNMESVVVNETATPVITELDNGTIKYTVNGTTKSVMLNN